MQLFKRGRNYMSNEIELPQYIVLDLETSIKNRGDEAVGNMKASPFHHDNKVVMCGWRYGFWEDTSVVDVNDYIPHFHGSHINQLIVGQNIKFDLLYMYRDKGLKKWVSKNKIWDTMLAEYLLTGQQERFASLDRLSEKYGGQLKPDRIKEYWNAGIDTEDIPKDELKEYLIGDILNTEIVFKEQYKEAVRLGMLPLIASQMDALLATTEMEWNGLHFDIERAYELAVDVSEDLKKAETFLVTNMEEAGIKEPNPSSNEHLSLLLFGGKQYVKEFRPYPAEHEHYGKRYKSGANAGKLRGKITDVSYPIKAQTNVVPDKEWKTKKKGVYKTNDDVLKTMAGHAIVKHIIEYRKLFKDLTTYYQGYGKLYWPNHKCIHGTFNHCATVTGRLSSSSPNLQNLSGKSDD